MKIYLFKKKTYSIIMDFSSEAPEQKNFLKKKVLPAIKKALPIAQQVLPVAATFVPALAPVATVVGAIRR
jgi:hypothetical protein